MYVSITGLRLKRWWHVVPFWRYAGPCFLAASNAPGNLKVMAKTSEGVRHTVTVWESREAMQAFVFTGVHADAIAAFNTFATGKTWGYETDTIPTWEEALVHWRANAVAY
ncbi:MAG: DUF3291 domain-containing protein [Pseudomonadota bacterium]